MTAAIAPATLGSRLRTVRRRYLVLGAVGATAALALAVGLESRAEVQESSQVAAAIEGPRSTSDTETAGAAGVSAAVVGEASVAAGGVAADAARSTGGRPGQQPMGAPARVVRTVQLGLEVPVGGVPAAAGRISAIAAGAGGFVQSSTTSVGAPVVGADRRVGASADVVVRVPSARSAEVTEQLGALGVVMTRAETGRDVTAEIVDLGARAKNLAAEEEALRLLVSRAKAVGEVLSVQQSLFDVRGQIERLAAQEANLARSADLATISVNMAEKGASTALGAPRRSIWARAGERLEASTTGIAEALIVGGAAIVPFAALAAAGATLVFVLRAPARRRRATEAGAAAPPAGPAG